jgi:hypothetical protein
MFPLLRVAHSSEHCPYVFDTILLKHSGEKHLFIVDFDDTIFPSTEYVEILEQRRKTNFSSRGMSGLSDSVLSLFCTLKSLGSVVLLTESSHSDNWMNNAIARYFSEATKNYLLTSIPQFYSRDTGRMDKLISFSELIRAHRKNGGKHVFSFSDSHDDQGTFRAVCDSFEGIKCGTIKFKANPKLYELVKQLLDVKDRMQFIIDASLDSEYFVFDASTSKFMT